jgi:hypothetical protein
MKSNLIKILYIIFLISETNAENSCIESRMLGKEISYHAKFPKHWFMIGGNILTDSNFHKYLKKQHSKYYTEIEEKGFSTGIFCAHISGVYLSITTTDFGPIVDYSISKPQCNECNYLHDTISNWNSETGLKLGLSKTQVNTLLGVEIKNNISHISYNRKKENENITIWNSHQILMHFKNDSLILFSISDYWEKSFKENKIISDEQWN